jgi:hypothetical protein
MEIIYCKQKSLELFGRRKQPAWRARKPEVVSWKAENRKKQLETREWIRKRGYWKPDIPESALLSCSEAKVALCAMKSEE